MQRNLEDMLSLEGTPMLKGFLKGRKAPWKPILWWGLRTGIEAYFPNYTDKLFCNTSGSALCILLHAGHEFSLQGLSVPFKVFPYLQWWGPISNNARNLVNSVSLGTGLIVFWTVMSLIKGKRFICSRMRSHQQKPRIEIHFELCWVISSNKVRMCISKCMNFNSYYTKIIAESILYFIF